MSSMNKQVVRCRCCGHQILAKEVMRTDLYERASGQTYVYVKFRCRRCKRLGQTFIPETRWDWSVLEPARDELSEGERDRLENAGPITESEMLDFHLRLAHTGNIADLSGAPKPRAKEKKSESSRPRFELKAERKDENRDVRNEVRNRDGKRDAPNHDTRLNTNGSNGEARPDDFPTGS